MSFTNLQSNVSKSECYCLNEQKNFPLENVFQGDDTLVLKSDADEQLMMYISFNESAKLHSINIGAADNENAPKLIHLFINRPNLGFSDMDDVEATQTIELSKSDLSKDSWTELKFVKFQRVQSLTIFVEENYGGDETHIAGLALNGQLLAGTNMNEFKKVNQE